MDEQMTIYTGEVKFWNPTRKYGFVCDDDSAAEFFVHVSELPD
jgi:cold shock CspA family protein